MFLQSTPSSFCARRLPRLLLGLLLSSGIGLLAHRRKSLSRSGIIGATITGTTTVGLGGWSWGFSLIFFFVSSSLLSHWRAKDKQCTAADKFSKGSQRDFAQVMANGGVATMMAVGYTFSDTSPARALLQAGYVGALATATADTWATELGVLSPHAPRLITSGRTIAPGTSGGVTPLGTAASAMGALALGGVFSLLQCNHQSCQFIPLISTISGLVGSSSDSVLGATVQAMYYCPTCDKETERRVHSCGTTTRPLRGIPWMQNDAVNFLATCVGSLVAMILQQGLQYKKRKHTYAHITPYHRTQLAPVSGSKRRADSYRGLQLGNGRG